MQFVNYIFNVSVKHNELKTHSKRVLQRICFLIKLFHRDQVFIVNVIPIKRS